MLDGRDCETGWLVNSNKIRCATRIFIRRLRDLLRTTPSAPLKNGTFLLRRSHPCLKMEGNELASTAVIDFEIACLMQSAEIRRLCAPHPLISQRVKLMG